MVILSQYFTSYLGQLSYFLYMQLLLLYHEFFLQNKVDYNVVRVAESVIYWIITHSHNSARVL